MASTQPHISGEGPDFHVAGGLLTIDLGAIIENYRLLAQLSRPAEVAAVVKADAYGLGAARVVPALASAGCRRFFVAMPHEGVAVRKAAPGAEVYVLSGPLSAEAAAVFRQHRLRPVLNSLSDVAIWESEGWDGGEQLPAALHVDTGVNRLGLSPTEAAHLAPENALTRAVNITLLMSHLACADDITHPLNRQQLDIFVKLKQLFPDIPASLANSAGILLGERFRFDVTRPGISLYGGNAAPARPNVMNTAVTAQARVLQVRGAAPGDGVGYGATARLRRNSIIAVVATGYADGYHRSASGAGVPLRKVVAAGGTGFFAGRRLPVLGRISMDLTAFDVTDVGPDAIAAGDMIELFGPNIPIDEAAAAAGTLSYEMLTSIGRRYHRVYVEGEAAR